MSEDGARVRSDRDRPATDVTVAEPVLMPMSPRRRNAVVAALAELLAADLDRPDLSPVVLPPG